MTDADWLTLLDEERKAYGNPTLLEIQNWTNIPATTLSRYFSRRTLPRREHLELLLICFDVDADTKTQILNLVAAARVEQRRTAGKRKTPPAPAKVPVSEIAGLTKAVGELTDVLREMLQEQRRNVR